MKLELLDATRASVTVDTTFTASELESLIRKLAALRSAMTPPVPQSFPKPGDPIPEGFNVLSETDASMVFAQASDGRFRFIVRSAGLGWCVYLVPVATARAAARYLAAKFPTDQDGTNLIDPDVGSGHLPH